MVKDRQCFRVHLHTSVNLALCTFINMFEGVSHFFLAVYRNKNWNVGVFTPEILGPLPRNHRIPAIRRPSSVAQWYHFHPGEASRIRVGNARLIGDLQFSGAQYCTGFCLPLYSWGTPFPHV